MLIESILAGSQPGTPDIKAKRFKRERCPEQRNGENQQPTIDQYRNIDSIKLKLSDELIQFLQSYGGTPPDGAPSVFMFRELGGAVGL